MKFIKTALAVVILSTTTSAYALPSCSVSDGTAVEFGDYSCRSKSCEYDKSKPDADLLKDECQNEFDQLDYRGWLPNKTGSGLNNSAGDLSCDMIQLQGNKCRFTCYANIPSKDRDDGLFPEGLQCACQAKSTECFATGDELRRLLKVGDPLCPTKTGIFDLPTQRLPQGDTFPISFVWNNCNQKSLSRDPIRKHNDVIRQMVGLCEKRLTSACSDVCANQHNPKDGASGLCCEEAKKDADAGI